jgi:hypothetical protein
MNGELLAGTFLAGFTLGMALSNRITVAAERFRRARHDWRTAKKGMKTLIQMMWRRASTAAGWAVAGALTTAAVVAAYWRST